MPVQFDITDPSGAAAFQNWLNRGMRGALMKGALSAAIRTTGIITGELIPAEKPQPVDRGAYRAGFRAISTDYGAAIINTLPYAEIIEKGARAANIKIGRAMIEELTQWIIRKGIVGKRASGKKKEAQLLEARSIAWAIAMSMKKRGIFNRDGNEGLQIMAKAAKRAKAIFMQEVSKEVGDEWSHR